MFFDKTPIPASEIAVANVKKVVEDVLKNSFGKNTVTAARRVQGRLSTEPKQVSPTITEESFYSMCGTFSPELQKHLKERGLDTEQIESAREDRSSHIYLTTLIDGIEVIIDPTIGQYLKGHNHVFVGTREQLRGLVINKTRKPTEMNIQIIKDKPYQIINTRSHNDPHEAFDRIWGEKSQAYGMISKPSETPQAKI